MPTIANVEMAAAWDGDEGVEWARDWERYDRAVRAHHGRLLEAAALVVGDVVLDVGCGNGESTRDAARAVAGGRALGVDLSSQMITRARTLARAEGCTNVRFEQADAQVHRFAPGAYDVVLSRFGAMFFADPVAAFRNIGHALRPGGRLALVAWRGVAHNEWLRCTFSALAAGRDLLPPPPGVPGPFGLADPDAARATLSAAGFARVDLDPLDEPFWLGTGGDDAFAFFRDTGIVRGMLHDLDDAGRRRALDALHATMVDHETGDGVVFGSGIWLITAHRPTP